MKTVLSKKNYDEVIDFLDRQCELFRKRCEEYVKLVCDAEKEGDMELFKRRYKTWSIYENYYDAALSIRTHFRIEFEVRKK